MLQDLLRDVVVIQVRIPMQCIFKLLGGWQMMGLQHLGNPAVEAFDPAMGRRCSMPCSAQV